MIRYFNILILFFLTAAVVGQNLITNPGAELDPTTNGWTQASGSWVSGSEVAAQDGSFHFFSGASAGTVELYQDVDVSVYATAIDAGTQDFYFSGYIRSFSGSDEGQIIVEYRDAATTVLSTYDTGLEPSTTWTQFVDTRTAPVNTRTIRIRLLSKRNAGSDNDGYMDDLLLNIGSAPLPIELVSFNVHQTEDLKVRIDWQTASEINNDFFTIERSIDAINWEELKNIEGAGNSVQLINYSTIDEKPIWGISYYRLKQTDFDGQYSYSKIESINIDRLADSQVTIFPNPTNNRITINGDKRELEQIRIFNMHGKELTNSINIQKVSRTESIINLGKLTTGLYYIKTKTITNKVYKQ